MMPQREVNDSLQEQTEQSYGRYEGEQASARQQYETSYEQSPAGLAGKVYPMPHDNKNLYRLAVFLISMVTLLIFAILAIFFIGGVGGWISLIAVASVIFLIAAVVIDKIE